MKLTVSSLKRHGRETDRSLLRVVVYTF